MSEDEVAATMMGALSAALWVRWYVPVLRLPRLGMRSQARSVLAYAPLVCMVLLFVVLRAGASADVRGSGVYLAMYMVIGAGWVAIAAQLTAWSGISARSDALERDNGGAAVALAGALAGVMLCYAGGNIGDGPGWWVVIYCAFLATTALLVLWYLLERFTGVAEQVTVERDAAASARLAGFLTACGLVLGRAVAGDWVSAGATLVDLARGGWPALVLLVVAVVLERRLRVTVEQPEPEVHARGTLPGLLYVGLAAVWVASFGRIV